jgi:hypothetical protein
MTLCDIELMRCVGSISNPNLEGYEHLYESHGVCKCLQQCSSIEYKTELVVYRYNEELTARRVGETTIEFKHKESEYFPYIRYQEFKTKDFLAYVGGLLGLFAGLEQEKGLKK